MRFDADSITSDNAAALLDSGAAAIRAGERQFDLSGVRRVDSSAVALLLGLQREARAAGARLEFVGLPADLLSLAELYGVRALIQPSGDGTDGGARAH